MFSGFVILIRGTVALVYLFVYIGSLNRHSVKKIEVVIVFVSILTIPFLGSSLSFLGFNVQLSLDTQSTPSHKKE